jgi:hypothetical protein
VFKKALQAKGDVLEVFGSGSLRRSTQLKPVHDVDLVVVLMTPSIRTGDLRGRPPKTRSTTLVVASTSCLDLRQHARDQIREWLDIRR